MKNLSFILAFLMIMGCSRSKESSIPTYTLKKGTFYIDVHEEGEIQAINSVNISSPNISWRYGSLKITQIVKDGSEVNAGDTVVVFDPSEVKKAITDSESSLEMQKAELEKMIAQHKSDLEGLRADYEVTKISQEISKITFESSDYEADIKRREIELNLEKANIALERSKEQIENRIKIQNEEIKQKNLSIQRAEGRLEEGYETLNQLFLVTPSPGIAIINSNWTSGNKFQAGDQCWTGFPLVQLPDLSQLKATIKINEVDISKVVTGLPVEIKPDAFSDSVYQGEVMTVANLAVNKDNNSKIKVFPVDILVKTKSKNLLPGLTVSCRLIVDQIDDVLFVPIEAVHRFAGEEYVYIKSGNSYNKKFVTTGNINTDYIIIEEGLADGDVIALTDPFIDDEKSKEKSE